MVNRIAIVRPDRAAPALRQAGFIKAQKAPGTWAMTG
jgi:hypothetical protein